ncbi:MAG: hypothetical protein NVS3B20_19250 [Polyangiales bacterium]
MKTKFIHEFVKGPPALTRRFQRPVTSDGKPAKRSFAGSAKGFIETVYKGI